MTRRTTRRWSDHDVIPLEMQYQLEYFTCTIKIGSLPLITENYISPFLVSLYNQTELDDQILTRSGTHYESYHNPLKNMAEEENLIRSAVWLIAIFIHICIIVFSKFYHIFRNLGSA